MRQLTSAALIQIAKQFGNEPVNIIGIEWGYVNNFSGSNLPGVSPPTGTSYESLYADKNVDVVPGKILQISEMDNTLTYNHTQSFSVEVTLDDRDGTIKAIMDRIDIHKLPVTIYQYLGNTSLADRFVVFKGMITTPIVWSEGDRTVQLSIVSKIDEREIGFSPEEGQFGFVYQNLIGKPWPLCFGAPLRVPATKVREITTGQLNDLLVVVNPFIQINMDLLKQAFYAEQFLKSFYQQVVKAADKLAPKVKDLISAYVTAIQTEDQCIDTLNNLRQAIEFQKANFEVVQQKNKDKVGKAVGFLLEQVVVPLPNDNQFLSQKTQDLLIVDSIQARLDNVRIAQLNQQIAPKLAAANAAIVKQGAQALQKIQDDIKSMQQAMSDISSVLDYTQRLKVFLEALIKWAEYRHNVKEEAFKKQVECVNKMQSILTQYAEYDAQLLKQRSQVKSSINILGGEYFPQGQLVQLLIHNLIFTGVFSGSTFILEGNPIPKYQGLAVGAPDPAGYDTGLTDVPDDLQFITSPTQTYGVFWIADRTKQLKGCYCLVTKNDGKKHIIYIREQVGRRLEFELIKWKPRSGGTDNQQGLIRTTVQLPDFSDPGTVNGDGGYGSIGPLPKGYGVKSFGQVDPNGTVSTTGLSNYMNNILGNTPYNAEEFLWLRVLDYLVKFDPDSESVTSASDSLGFVSVDPHEFYTILGSDITLVNAVAGIPLQDWFDFRQTPYEEVPQSMDFYAYPGTDITLASDQTDVFVANILPSTVKSVSAYRVNRDQKRVLTEVPAWYYTKNESENLGGLTVTSLTMKQRLSTIPDENWEDQIYVSLVSSVGPNIVDILTHLIQNYTNKSIDATSFNVVRDQLSKYPANFAYLTRPNVFQALYEIAWQARCAIYEFNDVFYLKYLASEPNPDSGITNDDIELSTFRLNLDTTENIVTKMVANWKPDYLPLLPRQHPYQVILRHNGKKYGLIEKSFDFYIFNSQQLVIKSATFWMIRLANTWKHIEFNTFLTKANLLVYDTIELVLSQQFAGFGPIKAIIEKSNYDSSSKTIKIQAWLPIRSGEMTPYPFAWPSLQDPNLPFPTPAEFSVGLAGGDNIGVTVSGPV